MTWCFVEKYLKVPNEMFPNCFQERQKRHKFQSTVHQKRHISVQARNPSTTCWGWCNKQGIRKTRGSDCPWLLLRGEALRKVWRDLNKSVSILVCNHIFVHWIHLSCLIRSPFLFGFHHFRECMKTQGWMETLRKPLSLRRLDRIHFVARRGCMYCILAHNLRSPEEKTEKIRSPMQLQTQQKQTRQTTVHCSVFLVFLKISPEFPMCYSWNPCVSFQQFMEISWSSLSYNMAICIEPGVNCWTPNSKTCYASSWPNPQVTICRGNVWHQQKSTRFLRQLNRMNRRTEKKNIPEYSRRTLTSQIIGRCFSVFLLKKYCWLVLGVKLIEINSNLFSRYNVRVGFFEQIGNNTQNQLHGKPHQSLEDLCALSWT